MIKVKIPATTANMGAGFDCIGMALEIYNFVSAEVCDETFSGKCIVESLTDPLNQVPRTTENLIYQSIVAFYNEATQKKVPSIKIVQEDYIPMTRGLGSSAACIVAGLAIANELSSVNMSRDDLAFLASKIEGHPDNVAPAIYGGVVVGVLTDTCLEYVRIENEHLKNVKFAVMIPDFKLSTEEARGILPTQISMKDGIFNTSRAALTTASFMTGDFNKLKTAMDDSFHQPYRQKIIPNMADIFSKSMDLGAFSVFLSGAGPTIIAMTDRDDFLGDIRKFSETLPNKWDINFVKPDFSGVQVFKS